MYEEDKEEEFYDEYTGQEVYVGDLIGTKQAFSDTGTIYRFKTDLKFDKLSKWEDGFSPFHYTEDVWNTAPFLDEMVIHFEKFISNYKRNNAAWHGVIGRLTVDNLNNLLWLLKVVVDKQEKIEIETFNADGWVGLQIDVPYNINRVLAKFEKYVVHTEPDYSLIGQVVGTIYDQALCAVYEDPYQEHLPSEIYEIERESYCLSQKEL